MPRDIKLTALISLASPIEIPLSGIQTVQGLRDVHWGVRNKTFTVGEDVTFGTQIAMGDDEVLEIGSGISGGQGPAYILMVNRSEGTFFAGDIYVGFQDIATQNDAKPIVLKPGGLCLFYATGPIYVRSTGVTRFEFFVVEAPFVMEEEGPSPSPGEEET